MIVLDSHCDTPSELLRGRVMEQEGTGGHVDFPKLQRGGVDASFFALYTPNTLTEEESLRQAMRQLAAVRDIIARNGGIAALATDPEEIASNKSAGKISIFLGMENGSPLCGDLAMLRLFYGMGVRYLTLTHNGDNALCDSAAEGTRWNGLSPFGREVVAEMNRLGMIVDIAHCSDKTFWDCIEAGKAPIVSTHSCCRALCGHHRNLSDEMIRALADKGGVVQINFYPVFLSDNWQQVRPGVKEIVDHIDHAVSLGGVEAVGIGTDFDGIDVTPEGLDDISSLPKVFAEMQRRGYSEDDIERIAGGNFIRVMKDVRSVAESLS